MSNDSAKWFRAVAWSDVETAWVRRYLNAFVHDAASVRATTAQLEQLLELLQRISDDAAESDQVAEVIEQSPYSGLLRYLPEGKEQWYAFVAVLVAILTLIVQTAEVAEKPPTVIVQVDEQRIIREIEQHIDQQLEKDRAHDKPPPKKKR